MTRRRRRRRRHTRSCSAGRPGRRRPRSDRRHLVGVPAEPVEQRTDPPLDVVVAHPSAPLVRSLVAPGRRRNAPMGNHTWPGRRAAARRPGGRRSGGWTTSCTAGARPSRRSPGARPRRTAMGGEARRARQHERGRLDARERLGRPVRPGHLRRDRAPGRHDRRPAGPRRRPGGRVGTDRRPPGAGRCRGRDRARAARSAAGRPTSATGCASWPARSGSRW